MGVHAGVIVGGDFFVFVDEFVVEVQVCVSYIF